MCDNLTTYVINVLKEFNSVRGILILSIMVGTPEWFYQHPFANLKKKSIGQTKKRVFTRYLAWTPTPLENFVGNIAIIHIY